MNKMTACSSAFKGHYVFLSELILLGVHGLHVLGAGWVLCVDRFNLLLINMYSCHLS
jgi:hypothetical protein